MLSGLGVPCVQVGLGLRVNRGHWLYFHNLIIIMGNKAPEVDPKEVARQNKRMIDKAIRTVERE